MDRHMYVISGVTDRETIMSKAHKASISEPDIGVYVHAHRYDLYGAAHCNDKCLVIRSGNAETVVPITRTADAPIAGGV